MACSSSSEPNRKQCPIETLNLQQKFYSFLIINGHHQVGGARGLCQPTMKALVRYLISRSS